MLTTDYPGEIAVSQTYWTVERRTAISELQQNGVALGAYSLNGKMADINEWFSEQLVYNAHVRAKATASAVQEEAVKNQDWPMFCVDMRDAVLAPHLFELMLDYYEFARALFDGEQPILYSMNAFWTQPARDGKLYADTHEWHRDLDDRKQFVIFIYGTDVDVPFNDGAHLYQIGTHLVEDAALGRHVRSPPPHIVKTVTGKAGTVFLSNTRGLHMGRRPNKLRMLAWGRWGVSRPPESYIWDKLQPVDKKLLGDRYPTSPEIQDSISFVVR